MTRKANGEVWVSRKRGNCGERPRTKKGNILQSEDSVTAVAAMTSVGTTEGNFITTRKPPANEWLTNVSPAKWFG